MSLRDLAKRYGTDKLKHGYISTYEKCFSPFRLSRIELLEIGVARVAPGIFVSKERALANPRLCSRLFSLCSYLSLASRSQFSVS